MKLKFKNRKKILIIASLIAIILIGAIVSIVVVFAANVQSTETNVKLTYVVNGVGAKVSANYAVLPNDESQLVSTTAMTTADSNETIEFKPSGGTQTASLEPAGDLILTTKKQRAVIEYIFENTANSAFSISLTDKPTGVNMTERYLVSGRRLNMAEYYGYITDTSALAPQALTSNGSVAYIYIMIEVANENKVASYEGEFKWVLEKQNTVTINLDNGDSTGGLMSLDIIPTSSVSGIAMPVINIFPTSTDETMGFAGYFAETNGSGTQYISDLGGSMNEADLTVTDKLYAYFSDVYYNLDSTNIVSLTEAGKNMSTLTIPSDVTSIATNAFYGADAEVITYDGAGTDTASYADSAPQLTIVGANAFGGCTNLKELRLPSSVTTIGNNALASCTSLETLEMPYVIGAGEGHVNGLYISGLSKLFGSTSFDVPTTLLHIIINGGTIIDRYAFYMCNSIVDISIPKSITNITAASLYCAQGLEYIRVDKDNSIYNDGDGSNCIIQTDTNNLIQGCKNTIIPESVVSISGDAFNSNKGLTDIVIPKNVETIGYYTFSNCINLSNITFAEDSQISSIGIYCFAACKALTRLTIPSSVTTIGNNALLGCISLETLEMPYVIGAGVYPTSGFCSLFGEDNSSIPSSLKNLTINGGEIADYGFYGCKTLKNVNITGTLTNINEYAFSYCTNITNVTISENVEKIELYVFAYCTSLIELVVDENNPVYNSGNGANCIIETATNKLVSGCKTTIIPTTVVDLGAYAFYGINIESISIPDNVTSIGTSTFNNCRNLKNITIPKNVTMISHYAFNLCINLESVTFEDPDGWFLATSITATSGTNIDVSDGARNAANLANLTDNANFTESWTSHYLIKDPWATVKYPQTYVGDELNETLKTAYSSGDSSLVATGKQYTTYADGTEVICYEYHYNGEEYARLESALPFDSKRQFLNSSGGEVITTGQEYWFKVEPIEFEDFTLSDGTNVKMTKMILASKKFDDSSGDWSTSELRTYINETFAEESGLDAVAKNYTQYSTKYSSGTTLADSGTSVTDKLWLADNTQIQEFYGTASESNTVIRKVATDFARATFTYHSLSVYTKDIEGVAESTSYYWLRSADSTDANKVWYILSDGSVYHDSCIFDNLGFCPVFAY